MNEAPTTGRTRRREVALTPSETSRVWFRLPALLSAAAYLACSLVLFRGVLGGLTSRGPSAASGDNAQMAWFLSWIPHALLHGQNPFLTDAINAPVGANLLWNTSMPLAGLVMTPITLTLGPLASLNLLYVLGPLLTAVTGRWWLSGHVASEAGRFVGGLMCGFGFFVTAHLGWHLNFVLLPLVPVILRLAEHVLWRARDHRIRSGVWLGIATAAQALLSEEIVAILVVGAFAATILAVLNAPRTVLPALGRALPGVGVAAVTTAVLLAFPLSVQLFGPNNTGGVDFGPTYYAAKRDFVVPSSEFLITPATQDANLLGRGSNPSEDGVYLGLPLVLLLAGVAIRWWRRWPVRVAGLTAVVGGVLALGSGFDKEGGLSWGRPAALVFHLPVLSNVLPARFGLVMQLACAWVLAMVVAGGVHGLRQRGRGQLDGALALAGSALVVVSLLPEAPWSQVSAPVPDYFTSDAVRGIPEGALIALLPAPGQTDPSFYAMLDQAMAGQRFRMVGGYAMSFNRIGQRTANSLADPLSGFAFVAAGRADGLSGITNGEASDTRHAMADLGVEAVVLVTAGDPDGRYAVTARRLYGEPDQDTGGVQMWLTD